MESGVISDEQITASSQYVEGSVNIYNRAIYGRLHFMATTPQTGGCWSAAKNNVRQWLQVDLIQYTKVTRVATQGSNTHSEWVKEYKLRYSNNGVRFRNYTEQGNASKVTYVPSMKSRICKNCICQVSLKSRLQAQFVI